MNPKLFSVFLLTCLLSFQFTDAWVGSKREPESAVQCTAPDGYNFNPGEEWYNDEQCSVWRCSGEPHNLVVHITGCGSVGAPDGCTLESGEGRYPDCCPDVVCP